MRLQAGELVRHTNFPDYGKGRVLRFYGDEEGEDTYVVAFDYGPSRALVFGISVLERDPLQMLAEI